MSDVAIRSENLSKLYHIGAQQRHDTLRDALVARFRRPDQSANFRSTDTDLWALRDVSFEVKRGEVVGVIGRNGAGKSTLLKILSRITEPTTGQAEIHGRVGSLLEVGTGFHPELTGRDNIYLNGAILGMRRYEIERKFDEIVAFSEIEKFLDTPVKRYSSGMYVRLAFAVAAHLEPEILLVDEVLAVGDAAFQKKCLGKMGDVAHEGRTVLFVSHNLMAIQALCARTFLVHQGKLLFAGDTEQALSVYFRSVVDSPNSSDLATRADRQGNQVLKFIKVVVCDAQGDELNRVLSGQDVFIRCYYVCARDIQNSEVHVSIVVSDLGYTISNLNSADTGHAALHVYRQGFFECAWPRFSLTSGSYHCSLFCSVNGVVEDWIDYAFTLNVEDGDYFGTGRHVGVQSKVLFNHGWSSQQEP